MTDAHSNYNGIVPSQANEWISQGDNSVDLRIVVNPVGLPADTYLIQNDIGDNTNILSQAQFALDMANLNYYVRVPTALPNVWTAWVLIGPGAAFTGVTSFNGRTGAVVSVAGDYTASQITNVPFGLISAVDVQTAIDQLEALVAAAIPKPAPAAVNDVLVYNGVNWVASSVHTTGNIPNLIVNTLAEEFPGTAISGAVGMKLSGDGTTNPYLFQSTPQLQVLVIIHLKLEIMILILIILNLLYLLLMPPFQLLLEVAHQ